jgi:hypothetical protein
MSEPKDQRRLLEDISAKLDKVVGFLAIADRDQNDQIKILRSLEYDWAEIGMFVGLTADAARMRFNTLKNGAAKDGDKGKSKKLTKGAE